MINYIKFEWEFKILITKLVIKFVAYFNGYVISIHLFF